MEQLLKIGAAINALRARSGDKSYGSRVAQGKFQCVRVTYVKRGTSKVEEVSGWMSADDLIAFVNGL